VKALRRQPIERFVEEVRDDEPELADVLSIKPVELRASA
jgi:hypothetical protein